MVKPAAIEGYMAIANIESKHTDSSIVVSQHDSYHFFTLQRLSLKPWH